MLPGFNNNDQYMALEGFTTGQHNRSDEAFTIADLEEFETANNMKLSSANNTSKSSEMANNITTEEGADDTEETTNETTTTRPAKTTTTRPAKTTTTRAAKKNTKKPTTTTKMSDNEDITMGDEDEYFKDLDPTSENTTPVMDDTEMEDPEMEDEPVMSEDPIIATEEENTELTKKTTDIEGFTGSRLIDEKWLSSLLKTILLTFIVYVVIHPGTSKVLTHFVKKSGLTRDLIVCGIFFLICYIIIISF